MHVTIRLVDALANVRRWRVFAAFIEILSRAQREHFRVIEFSLQDGHVHLLVEAGDWRALSNGMRGLQIRLARRLNSLLDRTGRAIEDRYHSRLLSTPREVRNCLVYVLQNAIKHARSLGGSPVDPLSSAAWFDGWQQSDAGARALEIIRSVLARLDVGSALVRPTPEPQTWLLRVGWRRRGLIAITDQPATA